jgi:hypothetical protein
MKKILIFSSLFICIFIFSACGSTGSSADERTNDVVNSVAEVSPTSTNMPAPTQTIEIIPTTTPEILLSVEKQVLVDNEEVVITLKSLSLDEIMGPTLDLLIENNSDKDIMVQVRNSVINDVMIDAIFSSEVAAGKKANDGITFMSNELKDAKIDTLKNFEFSIIIFDPNSMDTIFQTENLNINTSADPAYVQKYDDSGFIALDKNDIKLVIKKLDNENSIWGADIYVYIENNSGKDVTIQLRDVSINGFMVDPIFSSEVSAGKKAYDTITFLESDLKDNGIDKIDNIEFSVHAFDSTSWNTVFDSDIIKVDLSK